MLELHPQWQAWAGKVRAILREAAAAAAVQAARSNGHDQLDPVLLAGLRARYDEEVAWGITTNRLRDWHKGHHPGYNLAVRLQAKAEQVWLFTTNFAVPWTNNEPRSRPSKAPNGTRPFPGTGTPTRPSVTTAGSGPTSSVPAATASTPPTPCTQPSRANPGYHSP